VRYVEANRRESSKVTEEGKEKKKKNYRTKFLCLLLIRYTVYRVYTLGPPSAPTAHRRSNSFFLKGLCHEKIVCEAVRSSVL
jgi:hypothetical protein